MEDYAIFVNQTWIQIYIQEETNKVTNGCTPFVLKEPNATNGT